MKPQPAPLLDTYRALLDHSCARCRAGQPCEKRRRLTQAWREQRREHQPRQERP